MSALTPIAGLHHVTAFSSNPQQNLDFYTRVLGLRFLKRTVNFDDPGTYHFYFGDQVGSPGTIMTTFPGPSARRGVTGAGETSHVAFTVPAGSLAFWQQRLSALGVPFEGPRHRLEEQVLTLADPDGMNIELVAHAEAGEVHAPEFSDVPAEHAIRGFFGVTLLLHAAESTAPTLKLMGFAHVATEGNRQRFSAPGTALGNHIDLLIDPAAPRGRFGAGSVHHIAFRAADDAAQTAWRAEIEKHLQVTPVLDRDYFHSIYFRTPGGVLFELATDPPGFTVDEPLDALGEQLCLPQWLEPQRALIAQRLAPITLPPVKVSA
jgi:glyoxalase family protein